MTCYLFWNFYNKIVSLVFLEQSYDFTNSLGVFIKKVFIVLFTNSFGTK